MSFQSQDCCIWIDSVLRNARLSCLINGKLQQKKGKLPVLFKRLSPTHDSNQMKVNINCGSLWSKMVKFRNSAKNPPRVWIVDSLFSPHTVCQAGNTSWLAISLLQGVVQNTANYFFFTQSHVFDSASMPRYLRARFCTQGPDVSG